MNFNDWGDWAPVNIKLQIELLGNFYPGIVTYTSKNYEPSVVAGIPALNLDYCEGGAGHHIGLKAQKCTGMALLRYPGHLGYVVTNDDVMLSTWLTLAYRADWLWHKTKKPNHDYYYNCTANSQCYNCWSWSGLYGPIRFFRMHHLLRPWMLDIKMANFNRSDGCSCSMVDAFYVPGVLAHAFGYLSMASYYANAEVELATSTIYDTVALRSEREHLRNVFDGKHALTKYDPLLHDWAHSFKYSKPEPRERARAVAARAAADGWFYRPNITALRLRPFVYEHS